MKSKRLAGTLLAILCSTVALCLTVWLEQLTGPEVIDLFKYYCMLIGGVTGVYQGVQSFTDTKKITGGTGNGAE